MDLYDLQFKSTNAKDFIEQNTDAVKKYLKLKSLDGFTTDEVKNKLLEKYFTSRNTFLSTVTIKYNDKDIEVNIYKSKIADKQKIRFLVWFPQKMFCAMVWKEGYVYLSINDVSKTESGKNWYSYQDDKVYDLIGLKDRDSKKAFSKLIFNIHEEKVNELLSQNSKLVA